MLTRSPYGYVYDNPLNGVDPTGESLITDGWDKAKSVVSSTFRCNPVLEIGGPSPVCMSSQERRDAAAGATDRALSVPLFSELGPLPRMSAGPFLRSCIGFDADEHSAAYRGGADAVTLIRLSAGASKVLKSLSEWGSGLSHQLGERIVHVRVDW
jgi:hypothetical protein